MATTSTRTTTIQYTGDVTAVLQKEDAANGNSPGSIQLVSLVTGSNVITAPTGGSTTVAATITPPAGNVVAIRLKGNGLDTGILIHPTNPMTLSLDPAQVSFILSAASAVVGVQIEWT